MMLARLRGFAAIALLLPLAVTACHKEEQAVEGVAQTAVKAEQKAQATATELDQQRAALQKVPLPTKSMYVDIHDLSGWVNPFLAVGPDMLTLRIVQADANPSTLGQGSMLRPEAARRQEMTIRPADLAKALLSIPPSAWRYGRVIAIAESSVISPKDRPRVRKNVEDAIKQLNDLGIVVEEWPAR